MPRITINGKTKSGTHIVALIDQDSTEIYVDGLLARVVDFRLYRDGGTRIYVTGLGTLKLPHKMGNPDHHPRWNGEDIGEPSQEILEWREREAQRIQKAFVDIYNAESGRPPGWRRP